MSSVTAARPRWVLLRLVLACLVAGSGLAAVTVALASPAGAATKTITVCSKNATDYYNILGGNADSLRAKLGNPDNFGPGGKYGDYSFEYEDIGATTSETILDDASCDIYFSGYESDSSYTATELQELQDWVAASDTHQVVAGCDGTNNDPVCDALGFTVTTDTDSYGFIAPDLDVNPVNCDRHLGFTDQINMAGGVGGYFSGPGVTTDNTVAVHETAGAPDITKPIIVYTGNFLFTSDINMIESGGTEDTVTDGPDITSNNDYVVVNGFSALADAANGQTICDSAGPAPTPTVTTSTPATSTATTTTPATPTSSPSATRTTTSAGSSSASAGPVDTSTEPVASVGDVADTGLNSLALLALGVLLIVAGFAFLQPRLDAGRHRL